eukprot:9691195-Alexandrium_andersonii.AAC.1
MSASLVGSEMCIRDSPNAVDLKTRATQTSAPQPLQRVARAGKMHGASRPFLYNEATRSPAHRLISEQAL